MLCVRLDRGNISPAPLTEVGQADAYIKQLQVKCSSLYSATVKIFLGLWLKDGAGGAGGWVGGWWVGGFLCFVPPQEGDKSTKMQRVQIFGRFQPRGIELFSCTEQVVWQFRLKSVNVFVSSAHMRIISQACVREGDTALSPTRGGRRRCRR